MYKPKVAVVLLLTAILTSSMLGTASAVPALPSSFWGEIHCVDNIPSVGDQVLAYVDGVTNPVGVATIAQTELKLVYHINVLGDDSDEPGKDGGEEDDAITLEIGGRVVGTATWHSGTNVNLDLHPPEALPGGPYFGYESSPVDFTASANDWGPGALTYEWDWDNDGVYDETGQNVSHTWIEQGAHTVGLKVTDAQGGVGMATVQVVIDWMIGPVCESFESGYTLGAELRTHPDWFYEAWASGPKPTAGIGVAGSIGLSEGDRPFTWIAHPFDWNAPDFLGVSVWMDFQSDATGHVNEDRVGWVFSNTSCTDPFAVQLYPGGTSHVIQGYWDGVGGPDRTPTIVALSPLSADTWYRLRADVAKLTATSARIDVTLTQLDSSGNPVAVAATGSVTDTSVLGDSAPLPKYFTGPLWPAFKNYNAVVGAADNACFDLVYVPGSISIVKQADPEGDQSFEFGGDLGDFSLTDDGTEANTTTFEDVEPGTYAISETIPSNWGLTDIECIDPTGGTSTDLGTATAFIDLASSEVVTCTFANEEHGSISIVKDAVPDDPQDFGFTTSGVGLVDFSLDDDANGTLPNTRTFSNLLPGTYAVTETAVVGWDLTDLQCTAGGSADLQNRKATITLAAGGSVDCTFTNTKRGSITIVKDAVPNDEQDFAFTTSGAGLVDFSLDDDANGTLPSTRTFSNLLPGTYAVTETAVVGWDLTDLQCTAGGSADLQNQKAAITLAAGGGVTCTFTNTQRGSITIAKETDPDGGTDFDFDGDLGAFSLDDGGSEQFLSLVAGDYDVTEVCPVLWHLESVVCTGGDSTSTANGVTVHLDPGEDIVCTFGNKSYRYFFPLVFKGWGSWHAHHEEHVCLNSASCS
jgi:hypothetical protein